MKRIFLLLALTAGTLLPAGARVRLPALMGSGMVLQRDSETNIWGWTEPHRTVVVTASWDGTARPTAADETGRWTVALPTPGAGGPHTLTIDDGEPLTLDDILIGEVWLCSGQSNMEMPLRGFDGQRNPILLPLVVEAQLEALDLIPNAAIAPNTDLGDAREIHPPRKDLAGQRLAFLALDRTYGSGRIGCCGPRFESAAFAGGRAVISFRSSSTLLPVDTPLPGFEIAGDDRVFHPAEARVVHFGYDFTRQVEVWSERVAEPVAVRYAFRNVPGAVKLTDTAGLPAFPFRTDRWDDVYPSEIQ